MMMLEVQSVTPHVPCLHALSDAQRAIVEVLREAHGAAVSHIGKELGVTASAVRSQLVHLEEAGLVAATIDKCGTRGRPKYRYRLTMSARSLFSKRAGKDASEFSRAVLQEIRRRNPALVADVVRDLSATPGCMPPPGGRPDAPGTQAAASAS